jgi:TATA-box binding protein (TBP) (component of TFIID and TFIIIB)|tara:strand:- start:2060 stop:2539 length:480 start_codon:yes stop_codon:yes gene_type:complete
MSSRKTPTGSTTVTDNNNRNSKSIQTRSGITTFVNTKQVNNKKNIGTSRKLNNTLNIPSKRHQLINTYLTFAYEMRPGLENRIFWRYVILLLFSIDQITGTVSNNNLNRERYSKISRMEGKVSDKEQEFWSKTFMNILNNVKRINSSTTRPLYNRLPKI